MTVAYKHGTPLRRSGEGQGATMRVRAGALTRGEVTAVDHGAADALTTAAHPGGVAIGDAGVASSARATVRKVSALVTEAGTIGVSTMSAADDGTTKVELAADFGEQGVLVEAIVEANAACTAGALLVASSVGGYGCFRAASVEPSPVAFARLETAATTAPDGTFGTHASLVRRWVQLFPHGVATGLEQAGTVTTTDLAASSVTRAKIADPAGLSFSRNCAEFLPGIAGSQQRVSFSFDPTNTTDLTIRFKRRGLSLPPTPDRYWGGADSADRPVLFYSNTAGVYAVEMREQSTVRLSYTWTDDLEEHEWEFRYASTGCTILLDGATVASGATPSTFLDTSFSWIIAHATTSATSFLGDHATYRDFEVIDPATSTNKVYFRLDEGAGGPYRNAYLTPGDPLYDATNTSGVTVATQGTMTQYPGARICQTLDGGDQPAVARMSQERTRVAAHGGLGDSATAGQFGAVSWGPTANTGHNVSFKCARTTTQGGNVVMWGREASGYSNIHITNAGVVSARVNTSSICTSTVAVLPPDGVVRECLVQFRDSGADVTAAIYINGTLVASGTLAATQFSSVAADHYIGGNVSGNRRWSGVIYDVLMEDLGSAANSGFYLMDEPLTATSYANSYPTASLAGLTKNGYVGVTSVVSTDGRGMPFQSVGPLLYVGSQSSTQVLDGGVAAFVSLQFDAEASDPTSSFTLNSATFWTAPAPGTIDVLLTGVMDANADPADDGTIEISKNGVAFRSVQQQVGALAAQGGYAVNGFTTVAKDDTLGALFNGAAATTTLTLRSHQIAIRFTPTPTTG